MQHEQVKFILSTQGWFYISQCNPTMSIGVLVSYNMIWWTEWLKHQKFIFHSSYSWKVQDKGAGRFCSLWGSSSWLTDFFAVEYYSTFKRNGILITCYDMNEPWKRYAKWNKRSERQTRKREKERYTYLNAELQRIARRHKKAFLSEQCKEIRGK